MKYEQGVIYRIEKMYTDDYPGFVPRSSRNRWIPETLATGRTMIYDRESVAKGQLTQLRNGVASRYGVSYRIVKLEGVWR